MVTEPTNLGQNLGQSYPKVLALGSTPIASILDGPVEVTEKIDGSQFGFGMVDSQLVIRSKDKVINETAPEAMFIPAVQQARRMADAEILPNNHFFHAEFLEHPRQVTLAYDRVPRNNLMLFAAQDEHGNFFHHEDLVDFAEHLDIEAIPLLALGTFSVDLLVAMLDAESELGGPKIEGVVVKRFTPWYWRAADQHLQVMAGSVVSQPFQERNENTSRGGWDSFMAGYRTHARWGKAVQHLEEKGLLVGEARDIGPLVKEVQRDIQEECREEILAFLWQLFGKDLLRRSTAGLPEWYKGKLLENLADAGRPGGE